jgi:transcriptional regulator with PAS, ATPase and Fis domain
VEVNCAALPGNLLEAEVLGYEKGAFTDAQMAKPGLFEAAHGGTLFLDEVGDLPVELQGKLLRALETKRVRRLGG